MATTVTTTMMATTAITTMPKMPMLPTITKRLPLLPLHFRFCLLLPLLPLLDVAPSSLSCSTATSTSTLTSTCTCFMRNRCSVHMFREPVRDGCWSKCNATARRTWTPGRQDSWTNTPLRKEKLSNVVRSVLTRISFKTWWRCKSDARTPELLNRRLQTRCPNPWTPQLQE